MLRNLIRRNIQLSLLLVLAGIFLALSFYRLNGLAADDSFIHRRIALHYLQTDRAFYNLDQRVMVTSSPLWTILLALAGAVVPTTNPVPWLELIFVLTGAGAAFLLAKDGSRKEDWFADAFPVIAFLFVCAGDLPTAIAQMESPCAIALILTGSLGVLRKKSWGMPLLVLACFVRYECVLLVVLVGIWSIVHRSWTRSSLVASASVGILGIAWLSWQYGTVIPNTVIAKSHAYILTYRQV